MSGSLPCTALLGGMLGFCGACFGRLYTPADDCACGGACRKEQEVQQLVRIQAATTIETTQASLATPGPASNRPARMLLFQE